MPELKPHVVIKRLVEAEWPCPTDAQRGTTSRPNTTSSHSVDCLCKGTGRIVPFASLRGPCPNLSNRGNGPVQHRTCVCAERLWVPEPDVRVACWEVWKALPNRIKQKLADLPYGVGADTWEQAVCDEAEAWVKERHEPYKP